MSLWESVRTAYRSMAAQKLRTLLTMLGIIIGVGAVIALMAVGQGSRMQVENQIRQLGSNLILVTPIRSQGGRLELGDADQILSVVPQVVRAVPTKSAAVTVKYQTRSYDTSLTGVGADFPVVREFTVAQGRFFTQDDVERRRQVVVLGPTVARELFGDANPLGESVRIQGEVFQVIGVTASKGSSMAQDNDDQVWVPVTVALRMTGTRYLDRLDLQARSPEEAPVAVELVQHYYQWKLRRPEAVRVQSMDELLTTVRNVSGIMTMMLAAIAGISLVVGGIGIMNIMLVSVSERTREIGLRKALGARKRDILLQFLAESVLISLAGGVLGILLGTAIAAAIRAAGVLQTVVSAQSVWLSFLFAAAVGIFFGLYPAQRAANLDPIVALRRE